MYYYRKQDFAWRNNTFAKQSLKEHLCWQIPSLAILLYIRQKITPLLLCSSITQNVAQPPPFLRSPHTHWHMKLVNVHCNSTKKRQHNVQNTRHLGILAPQQLQVIECQNAWSHTKSKVVPTWIWNSRSLGSLCTDNRCPQIPADNWCPPPATDARQQLRSCYSNDLVLWLGQIKRLPFQFPSQSLSAMHCLHNSVV